MNLHLPLSSRVISESLCALTCTVTVASDCPSAKMTVVEVVVKTVVSEGVILHVAVTSPNRPADRSILQPV